MLLLEYNQSVVVESSTHPWTADVLCLPSLLKLNEALVQKPFDLIHLILSMYR
jgi:hypothetical protein